MGIFSNTSQVQKTSFTDSMAGSVDIGATPAWQKNSGHIPGTAPAIPSPVSNFKLSVTAKQAYRFPNALQEVYHS